jgi:hypothetical protein
VGGAASLGARPDPIPEADGEVAFGGEVIRQVALRDADAGCDPGQRRRGVATLVEVAAGGIEDAVGVLD